jgi:hypothetical protein
MVAPVFMPLPRQALGCGRRHNIGDQSRLGDMTTVAAPSRAARLGKSCLRSGACTLRYPLRSCRAAEKVHADHCGAGKQRFSLAGCLSSKLFLVEAVDLTMSLRPPTVF